MNTVTVYFDSWGKPWEESRSGTWFAEGMLLEESDAPSMAEFVSAGVEIQNEGGLDFVEIEVE